MAHTTRLTEGVNGHLVLGPGGGGGVAAELNRAQFWELAKFVRWSLERSDFRFLDWIDSAAFEYLSFLLKMFTISDNSLVSSFEKGRDTLIRIWESLSEDEELVTRTYEGVLANQYLEILTPAAKSELLVILAPHCRDPQPALAATRILDTVTGHRELVEVLKRMGEDSHKGSVQNLMTNYYRLISRGLFRSPQAERTHQWLNSVLIA